MSDESKKEEKPAAAAATTAPATAKPLFGGGSAGTFSFGAKPGGTGGGFSFGAAASSFGKKAPAAASSAASSSSGSAATAAAAGADDEEEEAGGEEVTEATWRPDFVPLVQLSKVEQTPIEESEDTLFTARAKLYRFDKPSNEWKERGVGDIKIMRHKETKKCRVLMRREKTFKICANHYITGEMALAPNVGNDKSWVYSTLADFADEVAKPETLAVRFTSADLALQFKNVFDEAKAAGAVVAGSSETPAPDAAPSSTSSSASTAPTEKTA